MFSCEKCGGQNGSRILQGSTWYKVQTIGYSLKTKKDQAVLPGFLNGLDKGYMSSSGL